MKNFKVEVSKWLEKYNLIKKAESEVILREELHKEGFAVLSVVLMDDFEISWNKFFFEINQNWNLKTWTILSNDIFKAYLKIKDELKYDLVYIYQNKDTSLEEKQKIIYELKEQYRIYLQTNKKELEKKQIEEKQKIKEIVEENTSSFQMKKELDETYKIIDKVLLKIKYFLTWESKEYLDFEKKQKLTDINNLIIKLKSSTNIQKLRQVWEIALTKVWEIELEILENKKTQEAELLLSETNKLLRQIWSKTSFIQKEKDLKYIFLNFLNDFKWLFDFLAKKKPKFEIDKKSLNYLKTKVLIEKYEKRLKELNKEILKNIFIYIIPTEKNQEKKINYFFRKKVIKQNLIILKSRLTWKTFSYTKIIKWYNYFIDKFLWILKFFIQPIFIVIFIYSFLFLILNLIWYLEIYDLTINFNGMFYFIYLYLAFILMSKIKGIFSLSFWFVIFSFLFIFWVINF